MVLPLGRGQAPLNQTPPCDLLDLLALGKRVDAFLESGIIHSQLDCFLVGLRDLFDLLLVFRPAGTARFDATEIGPTEPCLRRGPIGQGLGGFLEARYGFLGLIGAQLSKTEVVEPSRVAITLGALL